MNQFSRHVLCSILLVALFATRAPARPGEGDTLPFEADDTLEEIRYKIEYNGYDFTVDHNWVFDMDPEEKAGFLSRRAPLHPRSYTESSDIGPLADHLGRELPPPSFDWRNYNGHSYIGPVRDQGNCGSCYAFGACAAAEGTYNFAMGLYDGSCSDFSESFIMWCLGRLAQYSSHFFGCNGADWDYAELTALCNEGICDESYFPYTTTDPGSCTHWGDPTTTFSSWHRIPCNDVYAIKTAIMTYGVVDAAVLVVSAFQGYSGGVYEDTSITCPGYAGIGPECYYTYTNHAIALVGWDDYPPEGGGGVWILRNSWGTGWGESGYMRIRYNSAHVACEACYFVYAGPSTPTPTPTWDPAVPTYTPTQTPTTAPALAVIKEIAPGAAGLFYYNSPVKGDWTYWDAAARNPSPRAQDLWFVPSGQPAVGMAALDDYLVVMKREGPYDLNLYLYNGLVDGDWRYGDALARNPSPAARDLWMIPSGNDAVGVAAADITTPPDGVKELAVLKIENGGDMNIYYYNALLPGDWTYWDCFSRNPSPLSRDLWIIPGGNSAAGLAAADGGGGDVLALIRRDGPGDLNTYTYNNLEEGDWTYWDAFSRNPSALSRDLWIIPSGNDAVGMAAVDADGVGELAILKKASEDVNLYYYNVPQAGDWTYWDADARNPSPLARDLWMIPAGNDTVSIAAPR